MQHFRTKGVAGSTTRLVLVMMIFIPLTTLTALAQHSARVPNGVDAPQSPVSVDDIIVGIRARAASMEEIEVSFVETLVLTGEDDGLVWTRPFKVTKSGDRIKVTRTDPPLIGRAKGDIRTYTWDTKRMMMLDERPEGSADRRYSGLIAADRGPVPTMYAWRTFIEDAAVGFDETLAEVLDRAEWESLGEKAIAGYRALGIVNRTEIDEWPDRRFEIWVAPEHGFVALELLLVTRIRGAEDDGVFSAQRYRSADLQQMDGMWVATRGSFSMAVPPEVRGADDPRGPPKTFEFELGSFSRSLADEDPVFSIKYPVGARVADDISKASFVAGKVAVVPDEKGEHRMVPLREYPQYQELTDYSRGVSDDEFYATPYGQQVAAALGVHIPQPRESATQSTRPSGNSTTSHPSALESGPGTSYLGPALLISGALVAVAGIWLVLKGRRHRKRS